MKYTTLKKNKTLFELKKLLAASLIIGLLSALLAVSLKRMTEYYEEVLFHQAQNNVLYFIILPVTGLTLIYILSQYLFKKKQNKGIKEVFESKASGKRLPVYKIPSHFVNGLITVSFGGSTGIEVSTVVASAAVGSIAPRKEKFLRRYKTELMCAGITAGITALFCSPIAGLLFAYEVISKKAGKVFLLTNCIAALVAFAFIMVLDEKPLFAITIAKWNLYALPYFALLGVLAGINSVYLTKCVLFFKQFFSKSIRNSYYQIIVGAAVISLLVILLPQLYGDGYHAIRENILRANTLVLTPALIVTFTGILILKPIITSITLSAGGDGGVFAPGIFIGAFLGLFLACLLNTFFNAGVIPLNFMVIGMAAMLSASIHAPFTALFLICALVNDYTLFLPVLAVCLISKYTAKAIYPYTVYSIALVKP